MTQTYTPKVAGKKRPVTPKNNLSGASFPTKYDFSDGNAISNMLRSIDPTYAIPYDAINANLLYTGLPILRLIGDEFCTVAESQLNLLADLTAVVGNALTNNNGTTFAADVSDDESPLWNQTVANLASSSSQYLSLATVSSVQVGTASFMASIAFKTTTKGSLQYMFSYGSHVAVKGYWEMYLDTNNLLNCSIWDGTNTNTVTDTVPQRFQDGRWHIATMIVDRTNLKMYLICDGILIGSIAVTATLTITVSGESLYIGANKSSGGSIGNFWNGSLGIFRLANSGSDYNTPQVFNMGTREAVASGTFTTPTNDSNKRLNNKFGTPNTNGAYFYTSIFMEDGEYDIYVVYEQNTANGKLDILIDGNTVVSGLDTYAGSLTHNNISKTSAVKINAGRHTVKILNNGQNGSSSGFTVNLQWIMFVKRRGIETLGASRFLLLGDEFNDTYNSAFTPAVSANTFLANVDSWTSAANSNYVEGSLFFRQGFWRIDVLYEKNADAGKIDLYIGNVKAISVLDAYNASATYNNVQTFLIRVQQGRQKIKLLMNGKNASSSSYQVYLQSVRGVRLSD